MIDKARFMREIAAKGNPTFARLVRALADEREHRQAILRGLDAQIANGRMVRSRLAAFTTREPGEEG